MVLSLTLVIPVYNGAAFLRPSLDRACAWLAAEPRATELLVVDDGSTDRTAAVLAEFEAECGAERPAGWPAVRVLRNERNRGKGYSVRRAFVEARSDLIVFTDADLTYPVDNVRGLVEALEAGADLAIGSRMHPDSRYVVAPTFFRFLFTRHAMGRVFNLVTRIVVVPGVHDTQAGLKGVRRAAGRELAPRGRLNRFSFDVEMLFVARKLGLEIVECPVQFIYRKEPSTTRFLRDSVRMLADMAKIRLNGLRGRYRLAEPIELTPVATARGRSRRHDAG